MLEFMDWMVNERRLDDSSLMQLVILLLALGHKRALNQEQKDY